MLLHDEQIRVNDRVYDIIRNYGTVSQITANSIEVQFPQIRVSYDTKGVQTGKSPTTLFWDKPYILAPSKNSEHWTQLKNKFDAILKIVNGDY